jgi:hypothetical protein
VIAARLTWERAGSVLRFPKTFSLKRISVNVNHSYFSDNYFYFLKVWYMFWLNILSPSGTGNIHIYGIYLLIVFQNPYTGVRPMDIGSQRASNLAVCNRESVTKIGSP